MATNRSQADYHKQGIRIPKDLHARIHEAAEESGRSYNSELIARLQSSFDPAAGGDVEAYRAGLKALGVTNQALAAAILELAKHAPAKLIADGSALWRSVRMAEALLRDDQLAVFKDSVLAFRNDASDRVVHLDLSQAAAALTGADGEPAPPTKTAKKKPR